MHRERLAQRRMAFSYDVGEGGRDPGQGVGGRDALARDRPAVEHVQPDRFYSWPKISASTSSGTVR